MEEQPDPRLTSQDAEPGIIPLSDDFDWPPPVGIRGAADAKFIELLGPLVAYRLFVRLGGSRTYIPQTHSEGRALTAVIGEEGLRRLIEAHFGGDYIKVPLCREWRALVLRRQGYSYAEIAARLVMSQNKIWAIFSEYGGLNAPLDRKAASKRSAARTAARRAEQEAENRVAKSGDSASPSEVNTLPVRDEQDAEFGDLIEGEAPSGSSGQNGHLIGDASDERPVPDLGPTAAEKFARWRDAKLGERGPSGQIPKSGNLIPFPSQTEP